jgi:hypothetical protein
VTDPGPIDGREAVRRLHQRYPGLIPAPDAPDEFFDLGLEFFALQDHVCNLIDRRADKAARRAFALVCQLATAGDGNVRRAVGNDFLLPHLVFHEDFAWALERMPEPLAQVAARVRDVARESLGNLGPEPGA